MADPMWRQIAEDLRLKIESGELGSGGRSLPSELELQDHYRASRNTVRDAVKWLVGRGLVITKPGQGTFVVKNIDPFITVLSTEDGAGPDAESAAYASEVSAKSRRPEVSVPRVEIHQVTGLVAAELRLAEGTSVVSRHQERFIDGTPWSLQTSFYPLRYVEEGASLLIRAEDIRPGVIAYLEDALHIKQAGWRDRFTVRAPDGRETQFFGLPDDGRIAVFEIVRTGYDNSGNPMRTTISSFPADRNQFVMMIGQVPPDELAVPGGVAP